MHKFSSVQVHNIEHPTITEESGDGFQWLRIREHGSDVFCLHPAHGVSTRDMLRSLRDSCIAELARLAEADV